MNSQEIVSKLRFFAESRESIKRDKNLSAQGKERSRKNLEQSIELFRVQAHQALEMAWKDARSQYNQVAQLRSAAEILEGKRWNYERLNFETGSAERRLRTFQEFQALNKFLETELRSGNQEHVRAILEVAPGVIRTKFPGVESEGVVRELERKLTTLLDTPELVQVRKLEDGGGKQVLQLVRDTEEVARFYSEDVLFGGNEFSRLVEENVRIENRFQPDNPSAFQVTTITFNEPAAGAPAGEGAAAPAGE